MTTDHPLRTHHQQHRRPKHESVIMSDSADPRSRGQSLTPSSRGPRPTVSASRASQAKGLVLLYMSLCTGLITSGISVAHINQCCPCTFMEGADESYEFYRRAEKIGTVLRAMSQDSPEMGCGETKTEKRARRLSQRGQPRGTWRREAWRLLNLAEAELDIYDSFMKETGQTPEDEPIDCWKQFQNQRFRFTWRSALERSIPTARRMCYPGVAWRVWDGVADWVWRLIWSRIRLSETFQSEDLEGMESDGENGSQDLEATAIPRCSAWRDIESLLVETRLYQATRNHG